MQLNILLMLGNFFPDYKDEYGVSQKKSQSKTDKPPYKIDVEALENILKKIIWQGFVT
jgi:hypothetical protein